MSSRFVVARHLVSAIVALAVGAFPPGAAAQQPTSPNVLCTGTYRVSVTPDGATATWWQYTNGHTAAFTVTNNSDPGCAATFSLSYTTTGPISGVSLNKTSTGLLQPGGYTSVTATYNVGAPGSGRLTVHASGPGTSDDGYYSITVNGPLYTVSVTPDGGSQSATGGTSGNAATFTVTNQGNQGTLTYDLSIVGCTSPLTNCTSDASSVTVGQGSSQNVTAHFDAQNTTATGTITLRATHTASGTYDNGSINVSVTVHTFDVAPDGSAITEPENTSGLSQSFWGNGLIDGEGYQSTVHCTGQVTSCSSTVHSPFVYQNGMSFPVTFQTTGRGSGMISFTVSSALGGADSGWYNVTVIETVPPTISLMAPTGDVVVQYPTITIGWCDNATLNASTRWIKVNDVDKTSSFDYNTGAGPACTAHAASTTTSVPLNIGSNSVQAHICDNDGNCVTNTYTIRRGIGPVVDVSPYNFEKRDYGQCAAGCFAATQQYSTVPHFSLDTPRSVTLVYNGDRAHPMPFVDVNVSAAEYTAAASEYQLQVKINGTLVTFVNGEQTLRFAYPGTTAPARIGGQFDASSYATGVYSMDILASTVYADSSLFTTDVATKLVVVNESASPIARGWGIAGIEQLYLQGDGSFLITDGDGSAVRFTCGSGCFGPPGDFSFLATNGTGWVRIWPDSTKAFFDNTGHMTALVNRFNDSTTVTYNGSRVWQIKDPLHLAITLSYDTNGLTSIQDPNGRVTDVVVDSSKRLTTITDPDNISTSYGYDASLRLSTVTDRRGSTTTIGYDAQSRKVATVTAPSVQVVNSNGSVTTASPVTTFEAWQKKGVPYGSTQTPMSVPLADTAYARVTDPDGNTTRFTVNHWGAPAVVTNALGRTDSTRFDSNGLAIRVRSSTGAVDSAVYDARGAPTYAKQAGLPGVHFNYPSNRWHEADSTWTDDGLTGSHYFIGANGRVDSVRVAGGTTDAATTRYRYETHGRVRYVTDALGHMVDSLEYQGTNGNKSREVFPALPLGSRTTSYGYDAYGRTSTVSAPGLATTTTYYSIINRPDSVRDGVNPVATRYGYDQLFLTSVTDPKGQVYGFTYNALGWLTARTDPAGHADTSQYSRAGDLRHWINRRHQTITWTYDALHRRLNKSGTNTSSESWSYPSDTVVVATSPVAVDTLTTNRYGQLVRVGQALGGYAYGITYAYTTQGALDTVATTGAGIAFTARTYSWNTRLGTLTGIRLGGRLTNLANDKDAWPVSQTYPAGDEVDRSYTSSHATAGVNTSAGYGSQTNRSQGLDIGDRIWRQILNATQGRQYSYDSLGRLRGDSDIQSSGVTCDPHTPPTEDGAPCTYDPSWFVSGQGWNYTFIYDSAGNRTDHGGTYAPGNRITAFNGCTYAADSDGNVASATCGAATVTYYWSAENRLDSLGQSGQTTTFAYDAAGRLVRQKIGTNSAHYFLWDGDNLLAELDATGPSMVAEYSYYPGADNPHALIANGHKYYSHQDGLGNVIALTDSTAGLARTYAYWAWGESTGGGSDYAGLNGKDRARFKGALVLGPNGSSLYYMRARWYDAGMGRFLSEDPIGLAGGINPYLFAGDDPVNGSDPTGLVAQPCIDWYTFTVDPDGTVNWRYNRTTGDCGGGPWGAPAWPGWPGGWPGSGPDNGSGTSSSGGGGKPQGPGRSSGESHWRSCVSSVLPDLFAENTAELGHNLLYSVIVGPAAGVGVCTAIALSEPYLLTAWPLCTTLTSVSTTGILVSTSVLKWVVGNTASAAGAAYYCPK